MLWGADNSEKILAKYTKLSQNVYNCVKVVGVMLHLASLSNIGAITLSLSATLAFRKYFGTVS